MQGNLNTTSEFFLFVAGDSPRSLRAMESLEALRTKLEGSPVKVSVVDIFKDPPFADRFRVLATPTLVRTKPLPTIRLIGDFSDIDKLAQYLEIKGTTSNADTQEK